jgi:S1-C subfamily serine protease
VLRLAGMELVTTWEPATREGVPLPDLRIAAWQPEGETGVRLKLFHPENAWARAGLHTGDRLVSMNGAPVSSWSALRGAVARLRVGDSVTVVVSRAEGPVTTMVGITGYDRAVARIVRSPSATPSETALLEQWRRGW